MRVNHARIQSERQRSAGLQKREMRGATDGDLAALNQVNACLAGFNAHVIAAADEITVTFADGRELPAQRVGSDTGTDVAVVRVQAQTLPAIAIGNSDQLEVGDFVLAIGNPFLIGQTVTSGIVSALHRNNLGIGLYEDFIQTDAAIYPGNSGGALVNLRGELIGINTAFIGAGTNPGMGFAIPINMVRAIAGQIIRYGDIHRAKSGMMF